MKFTLILIGILFVNIITTNAQAQNNQRFLSLIRNYTVDSLLFCLKYTDDIKSTIETNEFNINQGWAEYPGEDTLNSLLVREFFFGGKNEVYV